MVSLKRYTSFFALFFLIWRVDGGITGPCKSSGSGSWCLCESDEFEMTKVLLNCDNADSMANFL